MRLTHYINELTEYKIYCDMDGVLVDFIKGIQDKIDPSMDGDWDKWALIKKDTWKEIKKLGESFWSELEWTRDGKKLWNYIKKYNPTILTAKPRTVDVAIEGKKKWVKKNLGSYNTIITTGPEKQNYANKNSILIDDSERNIKQWKSKEGIGILHKNTEDTIKQLKRLGI